MRNTVYYKWFKDSLRPDQLKDYDQYSINMQKDWYISWLESKYGNSEKKSLCRAIKNAKERKLIKSSFKLKTKAMKQVIISTTEDSVHVDCPHCDYWEELGIDDARHNLSTLPILRWFDERVSINLCTNCREIFKVLWDYE